MLHAHSHYTDPVDDPARRVADHLLCHGWTVTIDDRSAARPTYRAQRDGWVATIRRGLLGLRAEFAVYRPDGRMIRSLQDTSDDYKDVCRVLGGLTAWDLWRADLLEGIHRPGAAA